jgi:hypothetical protein
VLPIKITYFNDKELGENKLIGTKFGTYSRKKSLEFFLYHYVEGYIKKFPRTCHFHIFLIHFVSILLLKNTSYNYFNINFEYVLFIRLISSLFACSHDIL